MLAHLERECRGDDAEIRREDPDDICSLTPRPQPAGIIMLVVALIVLNLRKAYICALRITPNFVGVQTFDGLWTIYEKSIVTKFRPATQKELGEGCTSTDNECCGKQIVDDAAPERDCLKDHRCCINPSAETNTRM